jgi:HAD superfamily hydrolase (TIGR01509 family)
MTTGVFLDVDGTLIDIVYFHVIAWHRACRERGISVTAARVHQLIGMGGDQLVHAIVGTEMPELDEAHGRHMVPLEAECQVLPGARDLILELHRQDAHIAVSTSAGATAARTSLRRVVPDLSFIDTLVTRDDISATKPAPDMIAVALQWSGLQADNVIYVGDTNWDVEAAARCGIRTIGVKTGGWTEGELLNAGAIAVYDSVAHLLEELPSSPLGVMLGDGRRARGCREWWRKRTTRTCAALAAIASA